jgi:peptidylprolyl isomerase
MLVTVIDSSDVTVTLDSNHPVAGKDLTLDIKLIEIV